MKNMEALADGSFRVLCKGEECRITAEDVPYVVRKIERQTDRIRLVFAGGYREELDPTTLFVGGGNVLYCKVRGGKFTARFNRTSYLDLTKMVRFDARTKSYDIKIGGQKYPIRGVKNG